MKQITIISLIKLQKRNYKKLYDEILNKTTLENQFTQSIEYNFNNNDRNLIKQNTIEVLNDTQINQKTKIKKVILI